MVMNVRFMPVFPACVLVRNVGVLQPGVVVVMSVDRGEVLNLTTGPALSVMRQVYVLVAVHRFVVPVSVEPLNHGNLLCEVMDKS